MKKRITFMTAVFALFAILALPMGMKGQTTVTFTAGEDTGETSVTKDGITVSMSTMSRTDNYRCYANTAMTVASTIGDITSIDLTCTASGTDNYGPGKFSLTQGYSGSYSYSGTVGTWNGSAEEVSLTASSQVRMSVIVVTVGGSAPTSYIVTYDCNGGTSDCPVSEDEVEANSTIILADAPSREGFTFVGWNDGNTTYEAGYDEYDVNGNVTFTAQWTEIVSGDEQWVLTSLADLTENDVFVIVGNNGSTYAMSNDKGTASAPVAKPVTVEGNTITSTVASNIKWNVSGDATDGYTFYPNGTTSTWLYCTNTNNGVRVGTNEAKTFKLDNSGYLKHDGTSRYVGIYNSQDWRCYTSTGSNIANQTFAFYKKVTGEVLPPSITADNVSIEYNVTSGSIDFTINNFAGDGLVNASSSVAWLTFGDGETGAVVSASATGTIPFNIEENTAGEPRQVAILLQYIYGDNQGVSTYVTITQAAAPVTYTTIPALFDAATSTETNVFVTFNNWVVSGVSTNGKNVFVTDNNGNGFVIYGNEDMSNTYATGNVLSGTAVSCTLKKSNGYAQLLNVNATDLTITDGGTVSVANIALADLAGVNTGALVHYENMTCNINNNRYYLTDGATTIQLYNSLYAFDALENGETYNITGIYQQYNSTKEILPRSADDIEEVEVPTEEFTLTVSDPENITFTVVYGEEVLANGEAAEIANGTEITMTVNVSEGYVLESVTVVGENEQVVSITENNGVYSFYMPAYNATVNATAMEYIAPSGSNFVRISSLDQLTDGSVVVIASRYNETANNYFAMKNAIGSKIQGTVFESVTPGTNEVLSSTISDDIDNYYWVVGVTSEGYTFTNASGDKIGYGSSTNFATNGENTLWTVTSGTSGAALVQGYDGFTITNANNDSRCIALRDNDGNKQFGAYSTSNLTGDTYNFFLDFFVQTETEEPETYTLEIKGYKAGSDGGYYLIASPVTVDPATVGMTEGEYDLYAFDAAEEDEWRNYKKTNFNLEPGKGYLYAKQATTEGEVFQFELSGTPYNNQPIILNKTEGGDFPGWNLVGNPFGETAYINRDFYVMKEDGSEIIPGEGNEIAPMQGFFVTATQDGEELGITTEAPANTGSKIIVNVSQNRGNVVDRAIIRVNNGNNLPKFMLNPNNTKLYFSENGNEFAVVRSERAGRLPIVFKPSEDGEYAFNFNTENLSLRYLHLIDHETGEDIDLLRNPSYRFFAKTNNKPNRFELEYKSGLKQFKEKPLAFKDNFGYYSNGEIVINGTGDLQVFDLNGRLIKSETVNGDARIQVNAAAGVYMMQLITNDSVKTQKVVVK